MHFLESCNSGVMTEAWFLNSGARGLAWKDVCKLRAGSRPGGELQERASEEALSPLHYTCGWKCLWSKAPGQCASLP